ncbi:MAG: hypothetical protein ACRCSQ_03910, partial [Bacteroidales bacterium]
SVIIKPGTSFKINSIELTALSDTGTLISETTPNLESKWNLFSDCKDYVADRSKGTLVDEALGYDFLTVTSENDALFLMPQQITSQSKIIIRYASYDTSGALLESFESLHDFKSVLPALNMGISTMITMQLTPKETGTIIASERPWEEHEVEGDFFASYLNVSRTVIHARYGEPVTILYDTDYPYPLRMIYAYNPNMVIDTPTNGIITIPGNLFSYGTYRFEVIARYLKRSITVTYN